MKSYATAAEAMRATLQDGNIPVLTERVVRKQKLDVAQIALDLGCSIDHQNGQFRFLPGN
jgi:hypothetical protein